MAKPPDPTRRLAVRYHRVRPDTARLHPPARPARHTTTRKDHHMTATRLARAITVHLAWREDDNAWDGFALYLDENTAKDAAANDWESYEHGDFDEDDDRQRPLLTWETAYDRWHLLDDGRDTGVRVGPMPVYRPASKREIEAQDALAAAQEAARKQATPTPA